MLVFDWKSAVELKSYKIEKTEKLNSNGQYLLEFHVATGGELLYLQ